MDDYWAPWFFLLGLVLEDPSQEAGDLLLMEVVVLEVGEAGVDCNYLKELFSEEEVEVNWRLEDDRVGGEQGQQEDEARNVLVCQAVACSGYFVPDQEVGAGGVAQEEVGVASCWSRAPGEELCTGAGRGRKCWSLIVSCAAAWTCRSYDCRGAGQR